MSGTTVEGVQEVSPARSGSVLSGEARSALVHRQSLHIGSLVFELALVVGLGLSLMALGVLIWKMIVDAWPVVSGRPAEFLTTGLASNPAEAGVWQGIKGTLMLAMIVAVTAFPLGVGAAIYLEEYTSRRSRLTRFVETNVRNLAGVPSIVYGLLGLALFVRSLGDGGTGGLTGGRTVISGGLTLAVLVLPIVIITAQEAIRAVPSDIREAALALGATKWEVVRHQVFPSAVPGILTGTVLALARAAGEAAPLVVVGAVSGVFFVGADGFWEQITSGRFTAMPMVIFAWARLPASRGWHDLAAAAGLVLLVMVLLMNGLAIYLRNRYERRW
ncbi:MAG: phosphate ABC transporter, permease protein PstA [Acidimicrobiales bacterium]|nr:MAG: phosphate ABC transporter, permease protein PstA [Acidimicrobiales bacterium]